MIILYLRQMNDLKYTEGRGGGGGGGKQDKDGIGMQEELNEHLK